MTNKTVGLQENTDKQTQYKSEKGDNLKYSKTKLPWFSSVDSYNTRPGNEVGLFYNAPEPTRGGGLVQTDSTEMNWFYWAHLQPWGAELLNKLYNNTMYY